MSGSWTNSSISELTIPTSQTGGTGARIEINVGQSGEIQVFNAAGTLVDTIGGPLGEIISYAIGPTLDVALREGQILFGHAGANFAGAGAIYGDLTLGGGQQWDTGTGDSDHTDALRLTVRAGKTGQATGSATAPQVAAIDTALTSAVDWLTSGTVIHTDLAGNPDTWHPGAPNAGWALGPSGGSVQPLQIRRDAQNNFVLVGSVHSTSNTPSAAICNIPYNPLIEQRTGAIVNNGGTPSAVILQILPNGDVAISPNLAVANADVYIETYLPLGQIP